MQRTVFLVVCSLLAATTVRGQALKEYRNERFGFTLRYPPELVAGSPRQDGSGAEFHSGDGAFKVFAFAVPGQTGSRREMLRRAYDSELALFGRSASYKAKGDHWFVISGVASNGLEFYSKAYARGGAITLLRMTYPHAQHEIYDRWVTIIEKHFTPVKSG